MASALTWPHFSASISCILYQSTRSTESSERLSFALPFSFVVSRCHVFAMEGRTAGACSRLASWLFTGLAWAGTLGPSPSPTFYTAASPLLPSPLQHYPTTSSNQAHHPFSAPVIHLYQSTISHHA